MRSELELLARKRHSDELVFTDLVRMSALSLAAGLLAWLLRAGPLLASVIVSLPAWSRFDPLPVLLKDEDEEEDLVTKEDDGENPENAPERMFDDQAEHDELAVGGDS